jgi:hypothetical protein
MPAYAGARFSPPAPVAMVVLRRPDDAQSVTDVPMLIDSGADVTLVPKPAVTRLGLVGTGRTYELVGFDGTSSQHESVQADLVFLRRRFRGRYLLIDAEVGIIGRDVLNHLRLLLDGPGLAWDQSTQ